MIVRLECPNCACIIPFTLKDGRSDSFNGWDGVTISEAVAISELVTRSKCVECEAVLSCDVSYGVRMTSTGGQQPEVRGWCSSCGVEADAGYYGPCDECGKTVVDAGWYCDECDMGDIAPLQVGEGTHSTCGCPVKWVG
jgi:hypothetical protein